MRTLAPLMLCVALGLVACGSPIVGEECKSGLTACSGMCVDTSADYQNCGACGHDCGAFLCVQGVCSNAPRLDGGGPDAGDSGVDSGLDGSVIGTGMSDASFDPNPGLGGCRIGEQACGGTCSDPDSDHDNCGSCGHACPANQSCSLGFCQPACDSGLFPCRGGCLDFRTNPTSCGDCGVNCISGICEAGSCADALPGYAVVIGHDMVSANDAIRRLAGSAVFLARGNPVRVLAYRGDSDPKSILGVERAINFEKTESGRAWQRIDAIETIVPLQLRDADVFVIYPQQTARKSTLQKLGKQWGNALAQFVSTGGVVVLFEGPSTTNDGTFRVLEPAKIFSALGRHAEADHQTLNVVGVGFSIAMHLPRRYVDQPNTSSFQGVSTPGTTIVEDTSKQPVVIERVIVPNGP